MNADPSSQTPSLFHPHIRQALRRRFLPTLFLAATAAHGQVLWINEFHYDNTGIDAQEFVEIVAPAALADLAAIRLTLYNGGDGTPYGSSHLLSTFAAGESRDGWTVYSKSISGLQNGAPDGLALDRNGTVVQFVSYEGAFTAQSGPAASLTSSDAGVAESETTPAGGSLGLRGTGTKLADFTWTAFQVATPGMLNAGQVAVPEPTTWASLVTVGLGVFAWIRQRHRRGQVPDPKARDILPSLP